MTVMKDTKIILKEFHNSYIASENEEWLSIGFYDNCYSDIVYLKKHNAVSLNNIRLNRKTLETVRGPLEYDKKYVFYEEDIVNKLLFNLKGSYISLNNENWLRYDFLNDEEAYISFIKKEKVVSINRVILDAETLFCISQLLSIWEWD